MTLPSSLHPALDTVRDPVVDAVMDSVHGGVDARELASLGLSEREVIDFSANVNPFGPPPRVWSAMRAVALDRYPDRDCHALRAALAPRIGVSADWILCGNGAAELIHLIAQARVQPGDGVLVATPTFGEYARACALAGAALTTFPWGLPLGDGLDWDGLRHQIAAGRPVLAWICTPNNPTGDLLSPTAIHALLEVVATTNGLLVIDEAYRDLVLDGVSPDTAADLVNRYPHHVVVMRSLTKMLALAGLRLDYVVGHPDLLASLRARRIPWSVSALAQAAGLASLSQDAFVARSRERLAESKRQMVKALRREGWPVVEGRANWVLVDVGDAHNTRQHLLASGLLVRDCTSFGLPDQIRVAVRREREWRRLVTTLTAARAAAPCRVTSASVG